MSNTGDFIIENGILKKYVGPGGDVAIPEGVEEIGENAFSKCSSVRIIQIPASVNRVNAFAFNTGNDLQELVFQGSSCSFDRLSFYGCHNLKVLVFPQKAALSLYHTIHYCNHLEKLVISENMAWDVENHKSMFKDCPDLWDIQISDELAEKLDKKTIRDTLLTPPVLCAWLRGKPICPALSKEIPASLLTKAKKTACAERLLSEDDAAGLEKLLSMQKKLNLEELEELLEKASEHERMACKAMLLELKNKRFSYSDIEKKEQEQEEKELGIRELSLAEWRKLFAVSLVGGKACLGKYKGVEKTVVVPARVDKYPVVSLGEKAFAHQETVKTIYIEDGVEELSEKALWGCTNLQDVYIPASVTRIGKMAIQGKKRRIHAPEGSVAQAFAQKNGIPFIAEAGITGKSEEKKQKPAAKTIDSPLTVSEWKKIWSYSKLPDGMIRLDSYKGSDEDVVIPSEIMGIQVTVIGKQALSPSAPGARGIIWKQRLRIRNITIPETITTIEDGAFESCKELTEISVPNSVITIGKGALKSCSKLKKAVLPLQNCTLGGGLFYSCYELDEVQLPDDLEELGKMSAREGVFNYCRKLRKIVLPKGLKQIGQNTFFDCTSLSDLSIPESVTAIGEAAFSGCPNLTIHAPAGSYAERYAKENNIPFVAE